MREALKEAKSAFEEGEVPVGAVVVDGDRLIGRGHNRVEALKDATAHAEIIAIGAASSAKEDWRLEGTTMYVTVEPCMMCMGALFFSRVSHLVYGTRDRRAGACGGAIDLGKIGYMDRSIAVEGGLLESESQKLVLEFFARLRQSEKPLP